MAAARLSGQSSARIIAFELFPNVLPVVVVTASTSIGWMILETAGLSFLGLGAQPPMADLGGMLGDGRNLLEVAPHVATIPGIAILLIAVGVNLLGDGVRDILDPRLKSGGLARIRPATEVAPARRAPVAPRAGGPGGRRAAPAARARHALSHRALGLERGERRRHGHPPRRGHRHRR